MAARTPLSGVAQGLTFHCQDWLSTDNRLQPSILFQKTLEIYRGGCMDLNFCPEEAQGCREGELSTLQAASCSALPLRGWFLLLISLLTLLSSCVQSLEHSIKGLKKLDPVKIGGGHFLRY
jgi:hypothetical protein